MQNTCHNDGVIYRARSRVSFGTGAGEEAELALRWPQTGAFADASSNITPIGRRSGARSEPGRGARRQLRPAYAKGARPGRPPARPAQTTPRSRGRGSIRGHGAPADATGRRRQVGTRAGRASSTAVQCARRGRWGRVTQSRLLPPVRGWLSAPQTLSCFCGSILPGRDRLVFLCILPALE
jgi:hypothetical protein